MSLETGSGAIFEPVPALYRRRGFVNGAAFANYRLTDFNRACTSIFNDQAATRLPGSFSTLGDVSTDFSMIAA